MSEFEILVKWLRVRNGGQDPFKEYLFSEDCSEYLKEHNVQLNFDKDEKVWSMLFLISDWQ